MKELCLQILFFLKGKNLNSLTETQKDEWGAIKKKALEEMRQRYPVEYKTFAGFQFTKKMDSVVLTFKTEKE